MNSSKNLIFLEGEKDEVFEPVILDEINLARAMQASPQVGGKWEIGCVSMPEPILRDNERPFFPICCVVLESESGFCFGMEIFSPLDRVEPFFQKIILNTLIEHGVRPSSIVTTEHRLKICLEALWGKLGCDVSVGKAPAIEMFYSSLMQSQALS